MCPVAAPMTKVGGLMLAFLVAVAAPPLAAQDLATSTIETFAGNGADGNGGDGGLATSAQLHNPWGVAVDVSDNLYISADVLRKVDGPTGDFPGNISTFAQSPTAPWYPNSPRGLFVDSSNNLYLANSDRSQVIRGSLTTGVAAKVAGGTGLQHGFSGDGGQATTALVNKPSDAVADAAGNIYIADTNNHRIRRVDTAGVITTIAGDGTGGYTGDGGPAAMARINTPLGLAFDASGNLYIADASNVAIRKIDTAGVITTVAGTPGSAGFSGDGGPATMAQIDNPHDLVFDSQGNLYIADANNHRVRRVDADGTITTVAGTGTAGFRGDGGVPTAAQLNSPRGLAVDSLDNLYIVDGSNFRVRKVTLPAASISSTSPAALAESNLDGATIVVALRNAVFEAGATAADFELVTTIAGVSIASVSSGGRTATLTLASTADLTAEAELAVKVLAAGHSGSVALTTGMVRVASVAGWPPPDGGPPPNRAPEVAAALEAVVLDPGGAVAIDLSRVFREPDGDDLAYAAASTNLEVAAVSLSDSTLRVAAGRAGRATVTVSATDPDGLSASSGFVVSVGTALSLVGDAEAPEGGTARLRVDLGVPSDIATAFSWRVLADMDPATADADADDHGDAAGEGSIAAGERWAEIEVSILDDATIEPAREWFAVAIEATGDDPPVLGRAQARVAVLEGVCDRSAAVAAALSRGRDCTAPTPAELAATGSLGLAGRGIDALRAEDLSGLSGLRLLDLRGNVLEELPAGLLSRTPALRGLLLGGNRLTALAADALANVPELRELDLSDNALAALAPGQFAALAALRRLRLDGNLLEELPDGLFAGVGNLGSLRLDGNPGAPFALRPVLERTDAEPWTPGPATVRATLPTGAPFDLEVQLSVASVRMLAGETQSATSTVAAPAAGGAVRLEAAAPSVPETMCDGLPCWRGLQPLAGEPLVLFARPPRALPAREPEALFGDALRLPLASLAEPGEPGGELTWSASSSDPAIAQVRMADGVLLVEPVLGAEGMVVVEATATDANGQTAAVRFAVEVEFHSPVRAVGGWRGAVLQR